MKVVSCYGNNTWSGYIKKDQKIYVAICSYAEKDQAKAAGFRWHPEKRCWWSSEISAAANLAEFASDDCREELEALKNIKSISSEMSRASSSDCDWPRPDGLEYLPYQKAGITYMSHRDNTLLADDMGLGKTIQAIGLINADTTIKTVLVVCPTSIKINWFNEFGKWLVNKRKIGLADTTILPTRDHGYDITIIGYDAMRKQADKLKKFEWDLLIVDECHKIKNSKAKQTMAIIGGKIKVKDSPDIIIGPVVARKKILISGTPICNKPIELFPLISFLDNSWKPKFFWYANRYCSASRGRYGLATGEANMELLPELQQKLRETIMIRRLKNDVLKELPPKRRQIIEIDTCGNIVEDEKRMVGQYESAFEKAEAEELIAKTIENDDEYRAAVAKLRGFSAAFDQLAKIRHETALKKVPQVIEFVSELLECGKKVIVMCHHRDVQDAILKAYGSTAVLHRGGMSDEEKQDAVENFQKNDSIRVFVGSIMASGVGITLTAASDVVFAELDWVPGNVTQAEDRAHRIGQLDSVNVYHIVLSGSIDARMAEILIEKQRIIEAGLDNDCSQFIEFPPVVAKTKSIKRADLSKMAAEITDVENDYIHTAIKVVASYDDDNAAIKNGVGFSKVDTIIGKSLADCYRLTPKQAALAKVIVKKYRRQISESLYIKIFPIESMAA